MYGVSSIEGIESITVKYFVVGHSQNENDSVHATILREKERVLRVKGNKEADTPIAQPHHWVPIIRLAKKSGKPYGVIEMDTI